MLEQGLGIEFWDRFVSIRGNFRGGTALNHSTVVNQRSFPEGLRSEKRQAFFCCPQCIPLGTAFRFGAESIGWPCGAAATPFQLPG